MFLAAGNLEKSKIVANTIKNVCDFCIFLTSYLNELQWKTILILLTEELFPGIVS